MSSLVSVLACACVSDAGGQASPPAHGAAVGLDDAIRAARADAVRRTGLVADSLALVSAEHVTWSDGSLGCPQPDMMYTQALVPGYRVRLRGPGGEMDYHASVRGALVLCPAGRAVDPLPGSSRI